MKYKQVIIRNFSSKYINPAEDMRVVYTQYASNLTPALQLLTLDGEPCGRPTVNMPAKLEKDEVIIKDYAENEGMRDTLMRAGVISQDSWELTYNHGTHSVTYYVHKLCDVQDEQEIVL